MPRRCLCSIFAKRVSHFTVTLRPPTSTTTRNESCTFPPPPPISGLKFGDGITREKTLENLEFSTTRLEPKRASTNWPGNTKFVRELYAYVTRLSFRFRYRRDNIPRSQVTTPQASRQREERISHYEGGWNATLSPSIIDGMERELQENSVTYTQFVLRLPRAHNSRGEAARTAGCTQDES